MKKSNPKLKKSILDVVNNQLKSGDPPETRQTFNRLIGEGISEKTRRSIVGRPSL